MVKNNALFCPKSKLHQLHQKNPGQQEFLQAASDALQSLTRLLDREPQYEEARILERLVEPERSILFKVEWLDDNKEVQVNCGYRIQYNSALGRYKRGGLWFHPSVNRSILKFLAFEQTFKNSLTGLPFDGAQGGSDFNPKGKTNAEVMKFCQSFMRELYRHIGLETDVPVGGIGVGDRELGYLYGQYKNIVNLNERLVPGKELTWGSHVLKRS